MHGFHPSKRHIMDLSFQPNRHDSQPAYRQLFQLLSEKISNGELQIGDRLPPEREMAMRMGLSRGTVTSAYKLLCDAGIILSRQGSGYYIASPKNDEAYKQLVQNIDALFASVEEFSIPTEEIFSLFNQKLMKIVRSRLKTNVALIECNDAGIRILAKSFSHIPGIICHPILLSDIQQGKYGPQYFNEIDMLITTYTHHGEIRKKFPQHAKKIEQVFFSLTHESIIGFGTIPLGLNIGVLGFNSSTNAVIKRTIDSFGILHKSFDSCENIPKEKIQDYILQKDVLIIEPLSSILEEDGIQGYIDMFVAQGGHLVQFRRNVDQGSVRRIEEAAQNRFKEQYMAFLTGNIQNIM